MRLKYTRAYGCQWERMSQRRVGALFVFGIVPHKKIYFFYAHELLSLLLVIVVVVL